jgi:ankyrin repeat protein
MDARTAAKKGDVEALKRISESDPKSFSSPDDNGWTPFHEAVRVGNTEAVEIILNSSSESGSKNNLKDRLTYTGVTPLNIAREFLGNAHEVTKLLVELGAVDKHPHHHKATTTDEL